jgi:DNA (cytosine-5)-methyltransferase 1
VTDMQITAGGPPEARFRFVDLFAGIGGMRGAPEKAGGACVFSAEIDKYARLTYAANWGRLDAEDVREIDVGDMPEYDLLSAGFPCQPFSLAGVSKKTSLGREHGFADPKSGNLFFQIVRLIGGPWDLDEDAIHEESAEPDGDDARFGDGALPHKVAPPILLLENVRHLLTHDSHRTYAVIRRRLMKSGYHVKAHIINGASWVPQNRRRTVIVAVRNDLFDGPITLPPPPDPAFGPRLMQSMLEQDPVVLARYRLTLGVWRALERHMQRHSSRGNGFGRGVVEYGTATRTLSARYYKDGAEILIPMSDGQDPPRRLTPDECAFLMGFTSDHLGKVFVRPSTVSDSQAYRQFGNSVVVPQFTWVGNALMDLVGPVLIDWRRSRSLVA